MRKERREELGTLLSEVVGRVEDISDELLDGEFDDDIAESMVSELEDLIVELRTVKVQIEGK